MAPAHHHEVIDLVGDSDDDDGNTDAPPTAVRAKPRPSNRNYRVMHGQNRTTNSQADAIDLTAPENPLDKLDQVFAPKEALPLPNGRKSGFVHASKVLSNKRSDPLVIGSSDDERDYDTTAKARRQSTLPSKIATREKVSAASLDRSPAKRKRAPDDGDRKPSVLLSEKRRRVDGRPSESRSSSAGTDKVRVKDVGLHNNDKSLDALKRRENPSANDSSHSSDAGAKSGHVKKQKVPSIRGDLSHSERTHPSTGRRVTTTAETASDSLRPQPVILDGSDKVLAADNPLVAEETDFVAGATETLPRGSSSIADREVLRETEQDATKSIVNPTTKMGPPRIKNPDPHIVGRKNATNKTVPSHDSLSSESINQELSTQLHGEMAGAQGLQHHSGEKCVSSALPENLNAETKVVVPTVLKSDSGNLNAAGFGMLPLSRRIEHTVGKYLAEMRVDTEYHTRALLRRSRCSKEMTLDRTAAPVSTPRSPAGSFFSKLSPMAMVSAKAARAEGSSLDLVSLNVEDFPSCNKASYLLRPTQCSKDGDSRDVPGYAHYVSLKSNFLAPNVLMMSVWPYFGEDHVGQNTFDKIYNVDVEQRKRKLCRLLQAQQAEEYVESALHDLDISWIDVLRFLLDPKIDVGLDASAQRAWKHRTDFLREDFPESSDKWIAVLSKCTAVTSSTESLATAAILCDNFQRLAKFPLWHVARRCKEVAEILREFEGAPNSTNIAERTCRVCMRFNCFQHGEMRDDEGSGSEPLYEEDPATATDLVHPNKVNYRKRIGLLTPPSEHDHAEMKVGPGAKKDRKYWDNFAKVEERGPFYPCDHPGTTCEGAQCSCFKNNVPCEKTCGCSGLADCPRRYQGCSCSTSRARRQGEYVCFRDDRCLCYQLGRECDADLCGKCGVCDVIDPVNRHDGNAYTNKCHNANIQRNSPKHTLVGDSGVHGMGLYAGEDVSIHDFLGEYKGEVITRHEGDRRAAVYEHQNLSYLFTLNTEQEVDSTYYGNKIRFINHRPKGGANVYAVIVLVNTIHRIGLFAERPISTGQELFFDYGPKFPDEQLGGKTKTKDKESAPHVRNANLTKEFYDVEDSEDEVGNVRARKAPTAGRGRGRPRNVEPAMTGSGRKGGARPGAGRKPSKLPKPSALHSQPALDAVNDGETPLGERLAAYNVAHDLGLPVDAAAGADASEDEDFEPEKSANEASEGEDSSDYSDEGDEDEESGTSRRRRGRGTKARLAYTRSFRWSGHGRGGARGRGH